MKDYIRAQKITSERPKGNVHKKFSNDIEQKYINACLNCTKDKCNGDCSLKQMLKNGKGG